MMASASMVTPGPKTTFGSISTSGADHRIMGEEDRFRRDHRDACQHHLAAAALLPELFDIGEFGTGVAAGQFGLGGHDDAGAAAIGARDFHHVGQVIFALGIAVADAAEQIERLAAVDGHQAAIAERDGAFGFRCILVLADGDEVAVFHQQTAIAGRVGGLEADDDDVIAVGQAGPGGRQRRLGDERRIAIDNEQIVISSCDRLAGGQHGVAPCRAVRLDEGGERETLARRGLFHLSASRPSTSATSAMPAATSASMTWAIIGLPATGCRTLERDDFILVLSPAARTMARQERVIKPPKCNGRSPFRTATDSAFLISNLLRET